MTKAERQRRIAELREENERLRREIDAMTVELLSGMGLLIPLSEVEASWDGDTLLIKDVA